MSCIDANLYWQKSPTLVDAKISNTVKDIQASVVNDGGLTNNSCSTTNGLNMAKKEQINDARNSSPNVKGIRFCDNSHHKRYNYCLSNKAY